MKKNTESLTDSRKEVYLESNFIVFFIQIMLGWKFGVSADCSRDYLSGIM
jgi:hypothetical protein